MNLGGGVSINPDSGKEEEEEGRRGRRKEGGERGRERGRAKGWRQGRKDGKSLDIQAEIFRAIKQFRYILFFNLLLNKRYI